jgi:hypothetical protein
MKQYYQVNYGFGKNESKNTNVSFIPGETILCKPPYVTGKRDCLWLRGKLPNKYNQAACENSLGMKLIAIP